MNAARIKAGLGIGNDGQADWGWAGSVRLFLSRWFGIGHWFDAGETCVNCGAPAAEQEFFFHRVGPLRARCIDPGLCNDWKRDNGTGDTDGDR